MPDSLPDLLNGIFGLRGQLGDPVLNGADADRNIKYPCQKLMNSVYAYHSNGRQCGSKGLQIIAILGVKGAHDVFFHGQTLKKADVLEGTPHAHAGDLVLLRLGDILTVQENLTLIRGINAGNGVENGGFTGAVGADNAVDLPGVGDDGKILNGVHAAETQLLLTRDTLDAYKAFTAAIKEAGLKANGFAPYLFLAKVLIPMMSDAMLTNFIACGGVLSIAAGMRMAKIRQYPVIDMLPALALILVLTPLWERLFP